MEEEEGERLKYREERMFMKIKRLEQEKRRLEDEKRRLLEDKRKRDQEAREKAKSAHKYNVVFGYRPILPEFWETTGLDPDPSPAFHIGFFFSQQTNFTNYFFKTDTWVTFKKV